LNGTSNDAIMIVDSDEEEPPAVVAKPQVVAEFENEEHEIDPSEPFYDILQTLAIPLGAKVLALSVPPIAPGSPRASTALSPPNLAKNITVAAVCSDCSTKIVTLPLTPPPPQDEEHVGPTISNFQVHTINGAATHKNIASDIAITFTCQSLTPGSRSASGNHDQSMDVENESSVKSSRSGKGTSRTRSRSRTGEGWDLLVATYSSEATGRLLIYRIPILEEKSQSQSVFKFSAEHNFPIKKYFMHTTVTRLAFNPSPYPSERHSHLLVSTSNGAVKLYSCISTKTDRSSRFRRTSDADATREAEGKWLISLYPGFSTPPSGIHQRKPVLDAQWVLSGKAIIALLSDGEWGIWDIEGAGPGATQSLVRGQSNIQGVTGGALTSFAINSWITPDSARPTSSSGREPSKPTLAPMTPHTRKVREQTLFKPSDPAPATLKSTLYPNGSISVITSITNARDSHADESIVFNYTTQNIIIPSLLSFWRTKVKTAGTFESSARFRPASLEGISLLKEQQIGLSQFPQAPSSNYTGSFPPSSAPHPDILIIAEHRLHILAAPLIQAPKPVETGLALAKPAQTKEKDQALLTKGELDIDGMDRILEGMTNGIGNIPYGGNGGGRVSPTKRRRVGFA
jgi:hypothetical protein